MLYLDSLSFDLMFLFGCPVTFSQFPLWLLGCVNSVFLIFKMKKQNQKTILFPTWFLEFPKRICAKVLWGLWNSISNSQNSKCGINQSYRLQCPGPVTCMRAYESSRIGVAGNPTSVRLCVYRWGVWLSCGCPHHLRAPAFLGTQDLFRGHNFLFTSLPETPQRLTIRQSRSIKFSDTYICHSWLESMGQISSSGERSTAQVMTPCGLCGYWEPAASVLLRKAYAPDFIPFLCLLADSNWRMCASKM